MSLSVSLAFLATLTLGVFADSPSLIAGCILMLGIGGARYSNGDRDRTIALVALVACSGVSIASGILHLGIERSTAMTQFAGLSTLVIWLLISLLHHRALLGLASGLAPAFAGALEVSAIDSYGGIVLSAVGMAGAVCVLAMPRLLPAPSTWRLAG